MGSLQLPTEKPNCMTRRRGRGTRRMVQASARGSQRDGGPPGCLVRPNSPAPSALLELSWKFQVLSAAKKKKKKCQIFPEFLWKWEALWWWSTHNTGPQHYGEIQTLQCVHISYLADSSPSLSTVAPGPVKIKDAWSRRGILLLLRTHRFVRVCACDTVTFLIGIKLFFSWREKC